MRFGSTKEFGDCMWEWDPRSNGQLFWQRPRLVLTASSETSSYSCIWIASCPYRRVIRLPRLLSLYPVQSSTESATQTHPFQIPSYDHTKHTILNLGWMEEGVPLHVVSSMVAGFNTALTTSPVDVVKTRMMNQKGKSELPLHMWTNHSCGGFWGDCLCKAPMSLDCFTASPTWKRIL